MVRCWSTPVLRPRGRWGASLLLALSVAAPGTLTAQAASEGTQTSTAIELLTALMVGRTGGDVFVASPPTSLADILPYAEWGRVVGGVSDGDDTGIVVVAVEGSGQAALERLPDVLAGLGWTRPAELEQPGGGFRAAEPDGAPLQWCGQGRLLSASGLDHESGAYLRLAFGDGQRSMCNQEVVESRQNRLRLRPARIGLPSLRAPEGSVLRGGGSGMSGSHAQSEALIRTDLSAAALAAHFADQLAAEGWVTAGGVDGDGMSLRVWTVPREDGAWTGVLGIWPLDGGDYRAVLRLERAEGRP